MLENYKCPACGHDIKGPSEIKYQPQEIIKLCPSCPRWNKGLLVLAILASLGIAVLLVFISIKEFQSKIIVGVIGLTLDIWGGFLIATGYTETVFVEVGLALHDENEKLPFPHLPKQTKRIRKGLILLIFGFLLQALSVIMSGFSAIQRKHTKIPNINMLHITITKDLVDYAIAFTPFLVSLFTIGIAIYATHIAKRESKTNEDKLRLELYNKRLEIYTKTIDYFRSVILYDPSKPKEDFNLAQYNFMKAVRESQFLFEPSIHKLIQKMDIKSEQIIYFKTPNLPNDPTPNMHTKTNENEAVEDFEKMLNKLEIALFPYLDFQKIRS